MADSVRRYGASGAHEAPDSPERVAVVRGFETTRKWEGDYETLKALQPAIGDTDETDGDVTYSVLSRSAGQNGLLTVKYLDQETESGFVRLPFQQNPRIEYFVTQVDKPIESHPVHGLLDSGGNPDYTELGNLAAWKDAPASRKKQFQRPKDGVSDPKLDDDSDWEALTGNTLKIAGKIVAGMEAYALFVPSIRRVGTYYVKPTLSLGGKIETPPSPPPGTWQYLRLGDSLTQNQDGNWELVETWQGADKIDTDYYAS